MQSINSINQSINQYIYIYIYIYINNTVYILGFPYSDYKWAQMNSFHLTLLAVAGIRPMCGVYAAPWATQHIIRWPRNFTKGLWPAVEANTNLWISEGLVGWTNASDWLTGCLTAHQHRKVNLCQLRGRKPEARLRMANEIQCIIPHVTR